MTDLLKQIRAEAALDTLRIQHPLEAWSTIKFQGLTPIGFYCEGREYENARLIPLIEKLARVIEAQDEALAQVTPLCDGQKFDLVHLYEWRQAAGKVCREARAEARRILGGADGI